MFTSGQAAILVSMWRHLERGIVYLSYASSQIVYLPE